jgi:hypothetical protein
MIRVQDFDVTLPTTDSATGKLVNGRPFIQLMVNLSAIASLASRQQELRLDELRSPIHMLQDWIRNVPQEIALFDEDGNQKPHSRFAVETHIYYFVSIILIYLLPGLHRRDPTFHSTAILASSCVVHLYEAMLYRDEINLLLPIHAWLALVASIPQFYPLARSSQVTSVEEIELLRSTLVKLSSKHKSAKLCLVKIDELRKDHTGQISLETDRFRSHETTVFLDSSSDAIFIESVSVLFPFPNDISPRMHESESQLGTFNRPDTRDPLQPPPPRKDMTFEWADVNFDSFAFFGNEYVDENLQPFDHQEFSFEQ